MSGRNYRCSDLDVIVIIFYTISLRRAAFSTSGQLEDHNHQNDDHQHTDDRADQTSVHERTPLRELWTRTLATDHSNRSRARGNRSACGRSLRQRCFCVCV
jgi:hypothetical protein